MKKLNQIMFAMIAASVALSANAHVLVVLSDEGQLELKNKQVLKRAFILMS